MNIALSGEELVAFLVFCALIGPALMSVGMLWNRVRGLEKEADKNVSAHKEIFDKLDEVLGGIGYLKGRTNARDGRDGRDA